MGVTQSNLAISPFINQLTFIQTTHDKHFGSIDIYRTKQAPFEYIMNVKKHFVQDLDQLNKYQRVINQIKNLYHKNLAKIQHCQFIEENHLCIKHKLVQVFSNYYNFTLEKAIEIKKLQDSSFPENQLIYIMGCLLDLAIFLQNYGLSVGEYRSQSIFLSPEGYIKVYLLEPDEQNKHNCYYKALCQKNLTQNYIFAPEQLQSLNNLEYEIKYDIYKADVFAIGMVMLELITLDRSKFYYNAQKTALKMDRIAFDLSSMATHYSDDFITLLRSCLNPKPNDRSTLQEVFQQLNRFKKMNKSATHCVRLQEEQSRTKRNGRRENGMSAKGQHLLRGLQKKLTPSPITTMNSSTNNSITNSVNTSILALNIKTQSTIQQ